MMLRNSIAAAAPTPLDLPAWLAGNRQAPELAHVIRSGDAPSNFLADRVAEALTMDSPAHLHGLICGIQRIISTSVQVDQRGAA